VLEQPGSLGGLVQSPAPKVVPPGYQLSPEFQVAGTAPGAGQPAAIKIGVAGLAGGLRASRRKLIVPLHCRGEGPCSGHVLATATRPGGKHRVALARRGGYSIPAGGKVQVPVTLTKAGCKLVTALRARRGKRATRIHGRLELDDSGRPTRLMLSRPIRVTRPAPRRPRRAARVA
jgi:hypothetical protein